MDSKTAIAELASRVRHLERNQTSPEAARIMARGVLTSATRVALLMGVDLDTAGPTIAAAAQADPTRPTAEDLDMNWPEERSPLLQEINELQLEMEHPVVATGNRGFRSFWPRSRRRA
jgi:hypothetical protein